MVLWTVHREEFFEEAQVRGYIKADGRYVAHDVRDRYIWMARQMMIRGTVKKYTYPIWAWYTYGGKRSKPDLRRSGHLPTGTQGVCVEFDADEKTVLLSQFEMWVAVLNNDYITDNEEDETRAERLPDRSRVEQSWDRIFDLTFGSEDWWGPLSKRWIQACVPIVHQHQIRRVVRFIAK